jgi:uncharacterized protein YfdQ (DUF2303 family)
MDSSAIERIENLAISAYANRLINSNNDIVLADKNHLLLSTEKFKDRPNRQRSTVTAQRIPDFVSYANDHLKAESTLFIDPKNLGANLIFDYQQGWGDHTLELKLKETPEYSRVKNGLNLSQDDMQEWLSDLDYCLNAYDIEDNEIALPHAYQAISKVKIKATIATTNEKTNFKGSVANQLDIEATGEAGTLPAYFILNAALFEGMGMQEIKLRLKIPTNTDKLSFVLRIVGHDMLLEDSSVELEKRLSVIDTKIYVGTVVNNQPK